MSELERSNTSGLDKILNLLGIAASVTATATGSAGIGLSAIAVEEIARGAERRRTAKRLSRLENIVRKLSKRLTSLEQLPEDPEQLDLFAEQLLAAAQAEGEEKAQYQSALLDYILRHAPSASETRLLGEAIRALTKEERDGWVRFSSSPNNSGMVNKDGWREFVVRWQSVGLYSASTTVGRANVMPLGRKLAEVLRPMPN